MHSLLMLDVSWLDTDSFFNHDLKSPQECALFKSPGFIVRILKEKPNVALRLTKPRGVIVLTQMRIRTEQGGLPNAQGRRYD